MDAKQLPPPPHDPAFDDRPAEGADVAEVSDPAEAMLVHHPDGWYWLGAQPQEQFGPYPSAEEARAAMLSGADEEGLEPGETLEEAERELGQADWVDPETGSLAEDVHARIEEH